MAKSGAVSYQFEAKGLFAFEKEGIDERASLMELALEAGADDVKEEEDVFEVTCEPTDFSSVSEAFEEAGLKPVSAEVTKIATNTIAVSDVAEATKVLGLMEALDEADDVQNVYSNFDIDDEILAQMED